MQIIIDEELVTASNINAIREALSDALDQRAAIEYDQTVSVIRGDYPQPSAVTITIWHGAGRAAVACGGDSDWGDLGAWQHTPDSRAIEAIWLDATDRDDGPIVIALDGAVLDNATARQVAAEQALIAERAEAVQS